MNIRTRQPNTCTVPRTPRKVPTCQLFPIHAMPQTDNSLRIWTLRSVRTTQMVKHHLKISQDEISNDYLQLLMSRDWLRYGKPRGWSSYPDRGKILLIRFSRPVLRPTNPPIQWVQGAFRWRQGGRGAKLTTHLQLVPTTRTHGSVHPLPSTSSLHNA
jgi:hypothetical protein